MKNCTNNIQLCMTHTIHWNTVVLVCKDCDAFKAQVVKRIQSALLIMRRWWRRRRWGLEHKALIGPWGPRGHSHVKGWRSEKGWHHLALKRKHVWIWRGEHVVRREGGASVIVAMKSATTIVVLSTGNIAVLSGLPPTGFMRGRTFMGIRFILWKVKTVVNINIIRSAHSFKFNSQRIICFYTFDSPESESFCCRLLCSLSLCLASFSFSSSLKSSTYMHTE